MDTTHDLIARVGQLFIVGFAGQDPPAPLLNFIKEEQQQNLQLGQGGLPSASIQAIMNLIALPTPWYVLVMSITHLSTQFDLSLTDGL